MWDRGTGKMAGRALNKRPYSTRTPVGALVKRPPSTRTPVGALVKRPPSHFARPSVPPAPSPLVSPLSHSVAKRIPKINGGV
ncbi:hypothetical protein FACS1894104_1860 [Actinomycetota bacterium]|nr:hypothetical protein FACS1894104_1860 [Actinomycetota bacterium]